MLDWPAPFACRAFGFFRLDFRFMLKRLFLKVVIVCLMWTFGVRRMGSYEALPTTVSDSNHIQMKALTGTQA
ncbi:hypothetical protein GH714_032680 [Hevea brasiliensis]|uniref:Uncharacterized protein n=1 Tax=Hevea brasiliensis TaxID=3981 RepID=A0A6A6ND75_HEVBR|nr:hypothetical protein GH714_032680 [Hevea brasiliensis]